MGMTITEFKKKYCIPEEPKPWQQNKEGHALVALAEAENLEIHKVPGLRCAKLKPGKLEYLNSYPLELLLRFYGDCLNAEGLRLKNLTRRKWG